MKRKQKQKKEIQILTNDNSTFYQGAIENLPISEQIIKKISIEFYDNSEPCMIMKSAVLSMIYMEFDKFFEKRGYDTPILINELPKGLKYYVRN